LHSAAPAAFADVGALWTGLYSYAWFIGIGLAFLLYAALMLLARLISYRSAMTPGIG
jgi:cytosine/uracil/thiamine/allantoin permease